MVQQAELSLNSVLKSNSGWTLCHVLSEPCISSPSSGTEGAARGHPRDHVHFDETQSSTNVTQIEGETAYLQCTVRNVGNKSVRRENFRYLPFTLDVTPPVHSQNSQVHLNAETHLVGWKDRSLKKKKPLETHNVYSNTIATNVGKRDGGLISTSHTLSKNRA